MPTILHFSKNAESGESLIAYETGIVASLAVFNYIASIYLATVNFNKTSINLNKPYRPEIDLVNCQQKSYPWIACPMVVSAASRIASGRVGCA